MDGRDAIVGIATSKPMAAVAVTLGRQLGTDGELHDSSYYGGDYFLFPKAAAGQDVRLFPNLDVLEGEPFFPETSDCPLLMRMNPAPADADSLARTLAAVLRAPCRVLSEW